MTGVLEIKMKSKYRKSDAELIKAAKKYKTRLELQKENSAIHSEIYKRRLHLIAFAHMPYLHKPHNYWTKDLLAAEAAKYTTIKDFRKNSPGAYQTADNKGLLPVVGSHLKRVKRPNGSWTPKTVLEEAKKEKTLQDFRKNNPSAYDAARKLKMTAKLREILSFKYQPAGYWNYQRVVSEAKKYSFRSDFEKGSAAAYQKASRMKWLAKVCQHMKRRGNRNYRAIYVIEFSDRSAYVGLTHDYDERIERHRRERSIAGKKMQSVNFKIIRDDVWLPKEQAAEKELAYIERYAARGWRILNIKPAGSLGGNVEKWTKNACRNEIANCKTLKELRTRAPGAYNRCLKKGWLSSLAGHLPLSMAKHGYWTKSRIRETAKPFQQRAQFKEAYPSAYAAARRKGILDNVCAHMQSPMRPSGYWAEENIFRAAKSFTTRSEFKKYHSRAVAKARELGIIDKVCAHMKNRH